MVLQKLPFNFVGKNLMLKKDFNDERYIYILFCFIEPIKLYLESETQHVATAEYKVKFILPIICHERTIERKLVTFTFTSFTHGSKILSKTNKYLIAIES